MARQICCHKTDHRPLYQCQHLSHIGWKPYDGSNFKRIIKRCGNLMHAECIKKHGKCHKNAGVKEYERITGNS